MESSALETILLKIAKIFEEGRIDKQQRDTLKSRSLNHYPKGFAITEDERLLAIASDSDLADKLYILATGK
jgi:hypothetical protein